MNGRNPPSVPSRGEEGSKSSSKYQASPSKNRQMMPPTTPSKQPGLRRSPKNQTREPSSPVPNTTATMFCSGPSSPLVPAAKRPRLSEGEEEAVEDCIFAATRYTSAETLAVARELNDTKAELQRLAVEMGSEAADAKRLIGDLREELQNMRRALEAAVDEINSLWQEFKLLRDDFGALAE